MWLYVQAEAERRVAYLLEVFCASGDESGVNSNQPSDPTGASLINRGA